MAAIRPLKAKDTAGGPVAVPQPPSLADRLAEAQRAAEGPRQRVGELDAALDAALAREDFASAQALKDELAQARQEAAIAGAAVTGLQAAIAEIERLREQDNRAVQEQQQMAAARERFEAALQREREGLGELDAEMASVFAGLEAVKRTYGRALQIEAEVGRARAEQIQARVTLGEIPGPVRTVAPNRASILQDDHAVIRELMKWSGPAYRTPPPVIVSAGAPSGSARPFGGGGPVQPSPWR